MISTVFLTSESLEERPSNQAGGRKPQRVWEQKVTALAKASRRGSEDTLGVSTSPHAGNNQITALFFSKIICDPKE